MINKQYERVNKMSQPTVRGAEFEYDQIAIVPAGEYPGAGEHDVYYSVKSTNGSEIKYGTNEMLRTMILDRFGYSGQPGGLYCKSFDVYQDSVRPNQGIFVTHHRLDI